MCLQYRMATWAKLLIRQVGFVRSWRRPMWPKCPAISCLFDWSATNLLINSLVRQAWTGTKTRSFITAIFRCLHWHCNTLLYISMYFIYYYNCVFCLFCKGLQNNCWLMCCRCDEQFVNLAYNWCGRTSWSACSCVTHTRWRTTLSVGL